jgi:hypothetical protein
MDSYIVNIINELSFYKLLKKNKITKQSMNFISLTNSKNFSLAISEKWINPPTITIRLDEFFLFSKFVNYYLAKSFCQL